MIMCYVKLSLSPNLLPSRTPPTPQQQQHTDKNRLQRLLSIKSKFFTNV